MLNHFDIAICGAGPVGLTLALLLAKRGIVPARILLIDAKTAEQAASDPRSIALSYGSRQILEDISAWPAMVDPIHDIHVSRRGHFGRTIISRGDYDLPALGYVTRYGVLIKALTTAVSQSGITTLRPVRLASAVEAKQNIALHLESGKEITANIAVQAEGGVFSEQTAKSQHRDYQQTAIISHVKTSMPIAHRAFERFTDEGPLALLPQDDGYALVWCVRPERAVLLNALNDENFLVALEQAFGTRLGRFTSVSQRNAYPLGLNANASSSPRIVAIGNAAQTLHPVAGQGLNLGLRDATVLARVLAQDTAPASLERFGQMRKSDRSMTIQLTDIMARVFSSAPDGAWSQSLLGLSLGLIDAIRPAKRILAEQMMFGRR